MTYHDTFFISFSAARCEAQMKFLPCDTLDMESSHTHQNLRWDRTHYVRREMLFYWFFCCKINFLGLFLDIALDAGKRMFVFTPALHEIKTVMHITTYRSKIN